MHTQDHCAVEGRSLVLCWTGQTRCPLPTKTSGTTRPLGNPRGSSAPTSGAFAPDALTLARHNTGALRHDQRHESGEEEHPRGAGAKAASKRRRDARQDRPTREAGATEGIKHQRHQFLASTALRTVPSALHGLVRGGGARRRRTSSCCNA